MQGLIKGSWDLVTTVINKVTILIITYITPIRVLITLLTKSHDPPSRVSAGGCWSWHFCGRGDSGLPDSRHRRTLKVDPIIEP